MRTPDPVLTDQNREDILKGASELFQRRGLAKTTMRDIAGHAGKGKSTLYYYFKRKEDIFRALAGNELKEIVKGIAEGLKQGASAKDKVRLFFKIRGEMFAKTKLIRTILADTKGSIQFFHDMQREVYDTEITMLKTVLLEGASSGELKITADEAASIARLAITALHGIDINFLMENDLLSSEKDLALLVDICIRGMS